MKNKKIIKIIILILILFFLILVCTKMIKKTKSGNNMNSQKIVDYILNINSYKAKTYIQVNSNKNKNKYIINQEYNTEQGCLQEVLEPKNIEGLKIINKENYLTIENTGLDLKTIFENYKGLEDNCLDLNEFINDYKINNNSYYEEKNGEIILKTYCENNNKYIKEKILYINKEELLPTKLIINDNNQNSTFIIEYKEIELY